MYAFQGIALATKNYINPAIDTIKKKGIVSGFSISNSNYCSDRFRHHERYIACLFQLCSREFHRHD